MFVGLGLSFRALCVRFCFLQSIWLTDIPQTFTSPVKDPDAETETQETGAEVDSLQPPLDKSDPTQEGGDAIYGGAGLRPGEVGKDENPTYGVAGLSSDTRDSGVASVPAANSEITVSPPSLLLDSREPVESPRILSGQEGDAATRIQAHYRGYRARKQLTHGNDIERRDVLLARVERLMLPDNREVLQAQHQIEVINTTISEYEAGKEGNESPAARRKRLAVEAELQKEELKALAALEAALDAQMHVVSTPAGAKISSIANMQQPTDKDDPSNPSFKNESLVKHSYGMGAHDPDSEDEETRENPWKAQIKLRKAPPPKQKNFGTRNFWEAGQTIPGLESREASASKPSYRPPKSEMVQFGSVKGWKEYEFDLRAEKEKDDQATAYMAERKRAGVEAKIMERKKIEEERLKSIKRRQMEIANIQRLEEKRSK